MHIAVACGGTGGHIFPGLATADELIRRGHTVTLWLAGKDVENEAVKGWPGNVITVPAQGFQSGFSLKSVAAVFKLFRAIGKVKTDMQSHRPDIVLAMGSYASVGPVGAAIRLGIPFVMHESNVIPGRTVRLFSRWAEVIAGCFDETHYYLRRRQLILTGMPLRKELIKAATSPRTTHHCFRLLVMGGSRGARKLNEVVTEAVIRLGIEGIGIEVTHLTGEQDQAKVEARYNEAGIKARTLAFTRDMGACYTHSDFAICRAGAATCAELSTFGLPSLLIPYPHAIHDHQTANARAMEKVGAADLVPEKDLSVEWLVTYIKQMIRQVDRRNQMADAARSRSSVNGAGRLADLVQNIVQDSRHANY